MLAFVIQNQPNRAGPDLGRELVGRLACHGSTFSGVGASDQPGAVHGLEGMVSKRKDSTYRSGPTMNWRKIKCYAEKEMDIIGVQREAGKPAMVLMADKGRYAGGAFITFKAHKRQALWDRVQ